MATRASAEAEETEVTVVPSRTDPRVSTTIRVISGGGPDHSSPATGSTVTAATTDV